MKRVKSLAEEVVAGEGVVIAASIDIKDAFDSLDWRTIPETMEGQRFPMYLKNIVGN